MKVRKTLVLAGLAGGIGICTAPALAQQVVYDNSITPLGTLLGSVAENAANGWESGDEIELDGDSREINEIRIWFHTLGATGGTADTQVRLYEPDGPGGAPMTVLWDSGIMPAVAHIAGLNELVVPVPNVVVGDVVIWTIQHTNRAGSTGAMGPRVYNPPIIGSSEDFFWGLDAPGFPGWTPLWWSSNPVANFGAKVTATGTVLTGACCLPDGTCDVMTASACNAAQGLYQGSNSECQFVFCREPGACCMPDGTCFITAQHVCEGDGGFYHGDSTTCAQITCPEPGACCFTDGSCVVASSQQCSTAGGTYSNDGTLCGPISCSMEPVLLKNGPLSTGATSSMGVAAPTGTTWSELQDEILCEATIFGFGITGASRIADNFIIPGTEGWNIDNVKVHAYQTRESGATHPPVASPFTGGTVRIWDGPPNESTSNVVWGDTTTNRLASSTFADIYRIARGSAPTADFQRPIYSNELTIGTHLAPGHYWIDVSLQVATGTGFSPPVTLLGTRGPNGGNALQQTAAGGPWNYLVDAGPTSCNIPRRQELAFILMGTEGSGDCYANCDGSTTQPILNVDDFTCFINQFAAASQLPHAQQIPHYANCDNSTTAPVLNVDDFTCFINEFAQGCQ